jgi:hypothetical protein
LLIAQRQFARAARLPGKALAAYLILLSRGRCRKSQLVSLSSAALAGYGITRYQKEAALRHLEAAGLIRVDRQNGKNPQVTLLPEPETVGRL